MRSEDFIRKEFRNNDGKERTCSSIYKSPKGNIFSYGYHYPLLFTVTGSKYSFLNVSGYSSTTGRHISWARGLADFEIEIPNYTSHGEPTIEQVISAIQGEAKYTRDTINELTRHGTKKEKRLLDRLGELNQMLERVK